jgi:hypothetical protein
MAVERKKNAHLWVRDEYDWYVEPKECSRALFDLVKFDGEIWDPACGMGNIISSAKEYDHVTFSSDIVKRYSGCDEVIDFFQISTQRRADNIVCNPPFGLSEPFIQKSLEITRVGGKIACILPLVWMAGFSKKRNWLPVSPLRFVFPISPRPSMPPGAVILQGEKPGNGTKDFAWFVWEKGFSGVASLEFMNIKSYKQKHLQLM